MKEIDEVTHKVAVRHQEVLSMRHKKGWTARFILTCNGIAWYSGSVASVTKGKHAETFTFFCWELQRPPFCVLFIFYLFLFFNNHPRSEYIFSIDP